ncbi:MAG: hypothetical protein J6Q41_00865 [Firmicutes bacterium]|nr:hypothetical protein [Bacillota bacterium]
MHHLITAVASLMILGLLLSQFVANENIFVETLALERAINTYADKEYDEDEVEQKMQELKDRLDRIPNVKAEIRDDKLSVRLSGIIGPSKALGIRDNEILIEKDLEFRVREDEHEEFDDNSGTAGADGPPQPISDGDEPDSAG